VVELEAPREPGTAPVTDTRSCPTERPSIVPRALTLAMAFAFALAVVQCSQRTQQQKDVEDLDDCVRSFCGCWTDATLDYQATVVDSRGEPIAGAELTCMGEDTSIARSDATGRATFTIKTEDSPGCGLARCGNLIFKDFAGRITEVTTTGTNGDTVVLGRATDQSP